MVAFPVLYTNFISAIHVWPYSVNECMAEIEYEDCETDVDSRISLIEFLWFAVSDGVLLFLIEAQTRESAWILMYDEFGMKYGSGNFSTERFASFDAVLDGWDLTESQLRYPHPDLKIFTRTKERVIYRSERDGMNCAICGSFYPMAMANQPAGKLHCYSCRVSP